MKPGHQLAQRIGFEAAEILSDNYALRYINVPRVASALRAIRDDEIRGHHIHGKSAALLALDYGLTESLMELNTRRLLPPSRATVAVHDAGLSGLVVLFLWHEGK